MDSIVKPASVIPIILDLRGTQMPFQIQEDIGTVWQTIESQLVGKYITCDTPLTLETKLGTILLLSVDETINKMIHTDDQFLITNVFQNPTVLYTCKECNEYGPLRCKDCEDEKNPNRLCSNHALSIDDELRFYCKHHIPTCSQTHCYQAATFRCQKCYNLFCKNEQRKHPNDEYIDYCSNCYTFLFERCSEKSCNRVGRTKCEFSYLNVNIEVCKEPLCTEHSFQWKLWGGHNRGITLCQKHRDELKNTSLKDLLNIIITAKPPFEKRGKLYSLPKAFKLRRLINSQKQQPVSFQEIEHALNRLEGEAEVRQWTVRNRHDFQFMKSRFIEDTQGLPDKEKELLTKIWNFYKLKLDHRNQHMLYYIKRVEIADVFFKNQKNQYTVKLHLAAEAQRGIFIGAGGKFIAELSQQLMIEIKIV